MNNQKSESREIPIDEFDNACRTGKIVDAEIEDGSQMPQYTNTYRVRGTLNGEKVHSFKVYK